MTNLFFFHGEDSYSSTQKVQNWKKHFIDKYGDLNLETLEGKKLDTKSFLTNIEAFPFLSEKRLTIIRNLISNGKEDSKKKVAEFLKTKEIPDFSILVFLETSSPDKRTSIYKTLKKQAETEEFKNLEPRELTQLLIKKTDKNTPLSIISANYLIEYCGTNLYKLNNELEKLKSYCHNREIKKSDIEKICTPSLKSSIFKLTEQISKQNIRESIKAFSQLLESGEDPIKIFFMIVRHFRILIQIKDLVEKSVSEKTITTILKQHPFVIKKGVQQSRNFTAKNLQKIYKQLLYIDRDFKTGIIKNYKTDNKEYQLAIEKVLISACR